MWCVELMKPGSSTADVLTVAAGRLTVGDGSNSRRAKASSANAAGFGTGAAGAPLADGAGARAGFLVERFRRLSRSVGPTASALITTGFGLTFASTEFDRGREASPSTFRTSFPDLPVLAAVPSRRR